MRHIRLLRERLKMTRSELAYITGIKYSRLIFLEERKDKLLIDMATLSELQALSIVFDTDIKMLPSDESEELMNLQYAVKERLKETKKKV